MSRSVVSDAVSVMAFRLLLRGRVQGCGVRPAIARLALKCDVRGFVRNTSEGVSIHIESSSASRLRQFREQLPDALPPEADFAIVGCWPSPVAGAGDFTIRGSDQPGQLRVPVPPDVMLCPQCREEIHGRDDRRSCYGFISCTDCGPRYSIAESMPWERLHTSMAMFEFCSECRQEYSNPSDRRFHAQTNACSACGPHISLSGCFNPVMEPFATGAGATQLCRNSDSGLTAGDVQHGRLGSIVPQPDWTDDECLRFAASMIRSGRIVAVKGIGGYQLLCDATSDAAVQRLRDRKQRPAKPLATMTEPARLVTSALTNTARAALESGQNPIVLLDAAAVDGLSALVSSGLSTVGVLLPATPLHEILLQYAEGPLVVTSGNKGSEPLVFTDDADAELSHLADLIVHHNRTVVRPVDDSVVRIIADRVVTLRCARGIAPLPLPTVSEVKILAVGGNQKVAPAFCNGVQSQLAPHIGTMSTLKSRERFVSQVLSLQRLYGATAEVIAHDLHPDYFTSRWAAEQQVRTIAVQHHHAHIAAGLLEHGLLNEKVLGVAFDGTGLGTDGTIWGGEFLLADVSDFERVAHLIPFGLPGGESAVREPWRTAVSLLTAAGIETDHAVIRWLKLNRQAADSVSVIRRISLSPQTPQTTSMGRLFDGVAALVLGLPTATFEGELAMRLESACDESASGAYDLEILRNEPAVQLCWKSLLQSILKELTNGVPGSVIAIRFHRGIARAVAAVAKGFPELPVLLTGGCFQNRILTELVAEQLSGHPAGVFLPGRIPVNDGGLAAGQLAVAVATIEREQNATEVPKCA